MAPAVDDAIGHELDLLRSAIIHLELAGISRASIDAARRQVTISRRRVQRLALKSVDPMVSEVPVTVDELRERLGDRSWVQFTCDRGVLSAVVVDAQQVRTVPLGRSDGADRESLYLRSALHRCLVQPSTWTSELVAVAARRLGARIVAPLRLADGPVVLVPTAGLQATPWGIVPGLASRPFVTAPTAGAWCRAEDPPSHTSADVVLAAGPRLEHARCEVAAIGRHYSRPRTLLGASATAAAVIAALERAGVVHLVCHAMVSTTNPMFSALFLHDGPLFTYDLERVAAGPRIVILSACHAGRGLGLLASLLAIGTRTVVAAALPVPDRRDTVEAMTELHALLAKGERPASALARVRRASPLVAGAFNCVGAG